MLPFPFGNSMQPNDAEEEEDNNEGVSFPPGYTNDSYNFSEPDGQEVIQEYRNKVSSSIVFTPLVESAQPIFMSFLFGKSLFMLLNIFITLISNAFKSFSNAISFNRKLSFENRFKALAIGLGITLYILYKASKVGLVGEDIDPVFVEQPPMLFTVE